MKEEYLFNFVAKILPPEFNFSFSCPTRMLSQVMCTPAGDSIASRILQVASQALLVRFYLKDFCMMANECYNVGFYERCHI